MKMQEEKGYFIDKDGVNSSELLMQKAKFKPEVVTPKKIKSPYVFYVTHHFKK